MSDLPRRTAIRSSWRATVDDGGGAGAASSQPYRRRSAATSRHRNGTGIRHCSARSAGAVARRKFVVGLHFIARGRDDRGSRGNEMQSHNKFPDRKSTRLNSSHEWISYAVFCLKKKKKITEHLKLIYKSKNESEEQITFVH